MLQKFTVFLWLVGCSPIPLGPKVGLPSGPTPVSHGTTVDPELAEQVDSAVLSTVEELGLPGLAVALTYRGEVIFTGAYGWAELETERDLKTDTPVLLSSVSKTFIGIAAMMAVDNGTLTLDDPVKGLVGYDIDNPHVAGDKLLLRHLLTHNGAIDDWNAYNRSYAPGDPEEDLATFLEAYLVKGGAHYNKWNYYDRQPGKKFAYCNVGAALAAHAIAKPQGATFDKLVDRDILQPLGMVNSAYFLKDLKNDPAVPYKMVDGDFRPWAQYGFPTYPDGLMRSSADDMARYLAAIQGGGTLDGVQILAAESVETMLTVDEAYGTDEDGQAIIWSQTEEHGRLLIGHNGGDDGSMTEMRMDRASHVGTVILLNTDPDVAGGYKGIIALQAELHALVEAWAVTGSAPPT